LVSTHFKQRMGGLAVHAKYGPEFIAARARQGQTEALNARLLAELAAIVPGWESLSEEKRLERLSFKRREYYAGLALASSKARKKAGRHA
jgi:hypothetical protein